jgi:hypothetical protein
MYTPSGLCTTLVHSDCLRTAAQTALHDLHVTLGDLLRVGRRAARHQKDGPTLHCRPGELPLALPSGARHLVECDRRGICTQRRCHNKVHSQVYLVFCNLSEGNVHCTQRELATRQCGIGSTSQPPFPSDLKDGVPRRVF